jgi:Tfp pilus assembly protein PilF
VKKILPSMLLVLILCGMVAAQQRVNVRGVVYSPSGAAVQMNVRILLSGEDGQRPQEYIFTDSKGGFVIYGVTPGSNFTLVVETDGKNWATTTENVWMLGTRPFVTIHLRPLETPRANGSAVSLAEMNQNVPRGARKEYENAVEQLAAGDVARARKGFERAIELFPDFVEARSELAVILMREGELTSAEALLRRAIEIDAGAVRPQLNLGLCLYRQQRYSDALPYLERGVQLQPVNANGHLVFGITLVMAGDDARAEPVLRKAYEQGGKGYAKSQLYLSRLYARQKKYDRAAEALEIYLRDIPDDPNAEALRATLVKLRAASRP